MADEKNSFDLAYFVSNLNTFINNLEKYLFYKNRENKLIFKNQLQIKNEWLRQYAKQEFYESESARDKTKRKQTKTIDDFKSLSEKIEKQFDELKDAYEKLNDNTIKNLNERARKSKIGLLIKHLSTKNMLPFFISLVENTSDKSEKDNFSLEFKKDVEKINELLIVAISNYLPEQSSGLPIAKASFNYYTINKNPTDYQKEIAEKTKEMHNIKDSLTDLDNMKLDDNPSLEKKNIFLEYIKNELKENVTNYEELRQKCKNIKNTQKDKFNKLMPREDFTYEKLKVTNDNDDKLYLFNKITKEDFELYKEKTLEIIKKSKEINNCSDENCKQQLRYKLKQLKTFRGDLINAAERTTEKHFKTYKSFANFYGAIARKHGRILSQIKAIEKEKIESQLLNYWALILDANNHRKLLLIPKEKSKECYSWIKKSSIHTKHDDYKLYWFESLTFNALRKLCFGNIEAKTNTFNKHIQDIIHKHCYFDEDNKKITIKGEYSFKGDEQKIIDFYKDVLSSKYAQDVLSFPKTRVKNEILDVDFLQDENLSPLDSFKIALERICYKRYIVCPKDIQDKLKKFNVQIFNITSLDLKNQENSKNKQVIYPHKDKQHTQIWKKFWNDTNEPLFDIRINPEITITWRDAKKSRVEKYGKDSKNYDEKKKNRYLHEQFTLITTISEHCNTPTKDISFMPDEEFRKSIDEFNNEFKKNNIKFAIGIDNGVAELSTLGVYLLNFEQKTNQKKIDEITNIDKYGFKTLTIKNLTYSENDFNEKERKIVHNPSYFINKDLYTRTFKKTEQEYIEMFKAQFEEKKLLTLDLTTAKVISGYIVTNGDVSSHLNLRRRNAQQIAYKMNDHSKKETSKVTYLKSSKQLTNIEKIKFVGSLFKKDKVKTFQNMEYSKKIRYANWVFTPDIELTQNERNEFEKTKTNWSLPKANYSDDILFAVSSKNENPQSIDDILDVRYIFKFNDDFYALQSRDLIIKEIDSFNKKREIGNEELDLKIMHLRQAIVSNAIGVIDFLYKYYSKKMDSKGLVVKEGFDTKKVLNDLEKFSGNIYRILEYKLYQKFKNYGLVPPIKNLMCIREDGIKDSEKKDILLVGNIGFVSDFETSQQCPVCGEKFGDHQDKYCCENEKCKFNSENVMHSNDGVAGFNIAKKGLENLKNHFNNR